MSSKIKAKQIEGISGPSGDHGLLTGLGDDDHPQYLLKTDLVIDGGNFADSMTPSNCDFDGGAF